jgi:hypothetical protein
MKVSQVIQDFGTGTMYVGGASLFVMAVVGTMAIDIVMMAAIQKQAKEGKVLDMCVTAWMWHLIAADKQNAHPLVLLAISPITTAVAIGLSVAYEVPMVGVYLAGGWGIAASILLLGWMINRLGQCLEVEYNKPAQSSNGSYADTQTFFSTSANDTNDNVPSDCSYPEAQAYFADQSANDNVPSAPTYGGKTPVAYPVYA